MRFPTVARKEMARESRSATTNRTVTKVRHWCKNRRKDAPTDMQQTGGRKKKNSEQNEEETSDTCTITDNKY